jgi:hypothetical protein
MSSKLETQLFGYALSLGATIAEFLRYCVLFFMWGITSSLRRSYVQSMLDFEKGVHNLFTVCRMNNLVHPYWIIDGVADAGKTFDLPDYQTMSYYVLVPPRDI